jgi:hypothetical protein
MAPISLRCEGLMAMGAMSGGRKSLGRSWPEAVMCQALNKLKRQEYRVKQRNMAVTYHAVVK